MTPRSLSMRTGPPELSSLDEFKRACSLVAVHLPVFERALDRVIVEKPDGAVPRILHTAWQQWADWEFAPQISDINRQWSTYFNIMSMDDLQQEPHLSDLRVLQQTLSACARHHKSLPYFSHVQHGPVELQDALGQAKEALETLLQPAQQLAEMLQTLLPAEDEPAAEVIDAGLGANEPERESVHHVAEGEKLPQNIIGRMIRFLGGKIQGIARHLDTAALKRREPPPSLIAERRRRIATVLALPVTIATAHLAPKKREKTPERQETGESIPQLGELQEVEPAPTILLGVPEAKDWQENELTEKLLRTFEIIFGSLTKYQFIFADQNGDIIEEPFSLEPHIFPEDEEAVLGKRIHDEPIPLSAYSFKGINSEQKQALVTYCFEEKNLGKEKNAQNARRLISIFMTGTGQLSQEDRIKIRRRDGAGNVFFVPQSREELQRIMNALPTESSKKVEVLRIWDKTPETGLNQVFLNKWRRHFDEKYNERDGEGFLHVQYQEGRELPLLYISFFPLQEFSASDDTTFFDMAWKNAQDTVPYQQSEKKKLECAKAVFAQGKLPEELQYYIVNGIGFIETAGYQDLRSNANAVGPWQFLTETARNQGLLVGHYQRVRNKTGNTVRLSEETRQQYGLQDGWYRPVGSKTKGAIFIDERKVFARASAGAEKYFSTIYEELGKNPFLQTIQERYGLQDEDFLFPCVLSAYHCGETLMKLVIQWFAQMYTQNDITQYLGTGPYGMDIFTFMNAHAVARKPEIDSFIEQEFPALRERENIRYGPKSAAYAPKVIAISRLVAQKSSNSDLNLALPIQDYQPPSVETAEQPFLDIRLPVLPALPDMPTLGTLGAIGAGMLVGTAADATVQKVQSAAGPQISRRTLLTHGMAAGVAVAADSMFSLDSGSIEEQTPGLHMFAWNGFPHSEAFGAQIRDMPLLLDPTKTYAKPKMRKGSNREYTAWKETRGNINFFEDTEEVLAWAKKGKITPLQPYSSPFYRLRGVGEVRLQRIRFDTWQSAAEWCRDTIKMLTPEQAEYVLQNAPTSTTISIPDVIQVWRECSHANAMSFMKRMNHPDLTYVFPHTETLLNDISDQINNEFQKAGFPPNLRIRPIVTSAIRPQDYNADIRSAGYTSSDNSAHQDGLAIDLHYSMCDIVDPESGVFYALPDSNEKYPGREHIWGINKKHGITAFYYAVLRTVLKRHREAGDIILIEEYEGRENHHFHIIDKEFDQSV